jgi:hypothetical protein
MYRMYSCAHYMLITYFINIKNNQKENATIKELS